MPSRIEQAGSVWRHTVDQTQFQCASSVDRLTRSDHIQCRGGADKTRQPLSAARAWQQAELDFRQAQARSGLRHTVAADQGEFQSTTQGHAADGGDQRFVQFGQTQQQVLQVRLGKGSGTAELGNIRSRAKRRTLAVEDNRFHTGVRGGTFAGFQQLLA
ncbi:hypothetical protein PS914_05908 [Pseudomonas fluorescens]|nr:hypothetical protein PS914_05908 [Pseudomonas fluorescens]